MHPANFWFCSGFSFSPGTGPGLHPALIPHELRQPASAKELHHVLGFDSRGAGQTNRRSSRALEKVEGAFAGAFAFSGDSPGDDPVRIPRPHSRGHPCERDLDAAVCELADRLPVAPLLHLALAPALLRQGRADSFSERRLGSKGEDPTRRSSQTRLSLGVAAGEGDAVGGAEYETWRAVRTTP
jgi:hypothetical protein